MGVACLADALGPGRTDHYELVVARQAGRHSRLLL